MRWSDAALAEYRWLRNLPLQPLVCSMLRSTAERYAKRAKARAVRRADVEAAWREIQRELRRPGDGRESA